MAKRKQKPVTLAKVTAADLIPSQFVDVDDPSALRPGEKNRVKRHMSAMTLLHVRGVIDAAQLRGAELFAVNYEQAEVGGAQAIDYGKERVDGGALPEPLSPRQQTALDWLRRVRTCQGMGRNEYWFVRAVCGENKTIEAASREWAMRRGGFYGLQKQTRDLQGFAKLSLMMALDAIVEEFGLIGQSRGKPKLRSIAGDNLSSGGGEFEIDRLGDLVPLARA